MPLIIADLHLHSKYSRAVSRNMDLETMAAFAAKKGIQLLTTADITHPAWFAELQKKLIPSPDGLYTIAQQPNPDSRFILTTEISCIYSKHGKTRRIHLVVIIPDLAAVQKFNAALGKIGNLKADGRPILGLDAKEVVRIALEASPEAMVIPAHVWTPWFSLFGSKSGFDTIEECFEEMTPHIYAVETGLSSDPAMNWRLKQLDHLSIVSFSDAHSPAKMAREATVFDLETLTYRNVLNAIKQTSKQNTIAHTIEFFPEEGKYHLDGCAKCHERLSPQETKRHGGICPKCGKKATIGVLHRVDDLANREEGYRPKNRKPFKNIVPLQEIIANAFGVGVQSKKVQAEYERLVAEVAPEFTLLLDTPLEQIKKVADPLVAEGIDRVRRGQVHIAGGYDGIFGTVEVFTEEERSTAKKQRQLFS